MGAGEQKVVRLVEKIEKIPEKSLILIEEPELTLHPDAQIGLAWYLMAVAKRRGHQIIIATHSEYLFQTLPASARALIIRTPAEIEILHEVSTLRAARELTNTMRTNNPLILVEDEAALCFIKELLLQCDRKLCQGCAIVPVGNDDDVRRLSKSLRATGTKVIGVKDGDKEGADEQFLFTLPGGAAPETVLLTNENINNADNTLVQGAKAAYERAAALGSGHKPAERDKRILAGMANELQMHKTDLASRLAQIWVMHHKQEAKDLTITLTKALEE
jgi:hypothetical protein